MTGAHPDRPNGLDTRSIPVQADVLIGMTRKSSTPPTTVDEWKQRADDFTRREPVKAVVSAFGAGFIVTLLPLRAIASAVVGIAFASVRPALLFLGLIKACEFCRGETPNPS